MFSLRNAALIAAWTVCLAAGIGTMLCFEFMPGSSAAAPGDWPTTTSITRDHSRPTLVVFLHPRCPCSRATLAEIDRLLAVCGGQISLRIVCACPAGADASWTDTSLCRAAEKLPGAVVCRDADGMVSERFGATTSGQAMLYAADGRLLFQGGLTASRGHEGDNPGRAAVTSLIATGHSECRETAVFGCPLISSSTKARTTTFHGRIP